MKKETKIITHANYCSRRFYQYHTVYGYYLEQLCTRKVITINDISYWNVILYIEMTYVNFLH